MTSLLDRSRRSVRNLPLFWTLLLPFFALLLIVGSLGAFLVVSNLSREAQASLNQALSQSSVDARSLLHDRELYLLESADFAANLQGMADAARSQDTQGAAELLQSLAALKSDLDVAMVADAEGAVLADFTKGPDGHFGLSSGTSVASNPIIQNALRSGGPVSGLTTLGSQRLIATATPVCTGAPPCSPVGVALAGVNVEDIASDLVNGAVLRDVSRKEGIAIYETAGALIAQAGSVLSPGQLPKGVSAAGSFRFIHQSGADEVATLFLPFNLQGETVGILAVTIPTAPAFSSVRSAAVRLVVILLLAIIGIVVIGALLSRLILGQVRALVATHRSLGAGDLSARAPIMGSHELRELAIGVNKMAEQLQASHTTLETRVEQRTEEVRRLLRDRTELFSALSHEFRTPLAVIRTQAAMLLQPKYSQAPQLPSTVGRTIVDCSTELMTFVNEILDLASMELGAIEVELSDVDVGESIVTMRETIVALAEAADLHAVVKVPRNLPHVLADRRRLREIVLNLVDNAVKYTPPQGRISMTVTADDDSVALHVEDTGVGIPDDIGERVFDPFFRVEATVSQRGEPSSGLGLALTRRLVEAHGGSIGYVSVPGRGTTFTVRLPRVPLQPRGGNRRGPRLNKPRRAEEVGETSEEASVTNGGPPPPDSRYEIPQTARTRRGSNGAVTAEPLAGSHPLGAASAR